jgi:hypothetical protein
MKGVIEREITGMKTDIAGMKGEIAGMKETYGLILLTAMINTDMIGAGARIKYD